LGSAGQLPQTQENRYRGGLIETRKMVDQTDRVRKIKKEYDFKASF
jgi:hypothetical protein